MWNGRLGSGNASGACLAIIFLTLLNADSGSGAGVDFPLARPLEAARGDLMSALLFQKAQWKFTIPMKDQSSKIVFGNAMSSVGLISSRLGRMPDEVMMCPSHGA